MKINFREIWVKARPILLEVLITLALAIAIFLIIQFTIQSFRIYEQCMEPNFHEGERVLVNKVIFHFTDPKRGDVIILHPPINPEAVYIKRVIAIPGDTVEVKDGAVYINGIRLDEPYIKEPPTYTMSAVKIAENQYFVLGDNRNNANDSHKWGTVSRENIIGKAWLVFWPLSDWGFVHHYPLADQLPSSSE